MQIALFVTCLADTFLPRHAIAVVKVLERLGHDVAFPAQQTCCGQPQYNNGYHFEARRLAARMIRVFEPYETIVTPSGSCAAMIRDYYPGLFPLGSDERAASRALAERTYEFVEFLTRVEGIDPHDPQTLTRLSVNWEGSATYHYSCHLRGIGMRDEAARLAARIKGLDFAPLDKLDQCCGFGGTFCLKYPQLSGAMTREKIESVRRTEAKTLIVNDPGCAMNLAGACRRHQLDVEVKSLAEILAEGMGLLPRERGL